MKSRGFALITVLLIVIIVPIVVFGISAFITSSVSRYDAQTRRMKALYLAQAGIHRAIFNIRSTGTPLPVANWDLDNTIVVTVVAQCSGIYQLKSVGTSIASGNSIERTVFAQYNATANKISLYLEGDGAGVPPPTCCDEIHWPYEEGAGLTTTSTGGLVGQFGNGNSWPSAGATWLTAITSPAAKVGNYAIRFAPAAGNVTYYVRVADTAALDLSTSGTVMAWVNFSNVTTNAGLVHKGQQTNNSDMAYSLALDNSRRLAFTVASGTNAASRTTLGSVTQPPANTWVHVAGTWDPSGMALYYNGQAINTNAIAKTAQNSSGSLQHGSKYPSNNNTRCRGSMDDVYIYPCARTAAEIKTYYNATCSPQPACQVP